MNNFVMPFHDLLFVFVFSLNQAVSIIVFASFHDPVFIFVFFCEVVRL